VSECLAAGSLGRGVAGNYCRQAPVGALAEQSRPPGAPKIWRMSIANLAYIGLEVSDLPAWRTAAIEVFGMQPAPASAGQLEPFRLDERAWRLALHPSPRDDISYAGFEVADARALERLASKLHGSHRNLEPEECRSRAVSGGIKLLDPDGLELHLIHGLARAATPFKSSRDVTFVTGGMGLGHIVISVSDLDRSMAFYQQLGFNVSDYIRVQLTSESSVNVVFMHCNPRHHTIALLPAPTPKRLNHLMVEVSTVDEVLNAYYRAQKGGLRIARHMGRHVNDHMLSFYATTPSGFDIEYGCGARHVGSGWAIEQYDRISFWGHETL